MKKATQFIFTLLIGTIGFSSCQTSNVSASNEQSSIKPMASTLSTLANSNWTLVNYSKNKFDSKYEKMVTLSFGAGANSKAGFSGKSFVNYYMGGLEIDETKGLVLSKTNVASTKMAALDENLMKLEVGFYENFEKAKFFEIVNSQFLVYLGDKLDSKTEIMVFVKAN